ncbi:PREDICTED: uncharacterized protein LOC109153930 [Ipomoea nil]|uniref:uncharacterized protein LOC109153930 n=1 Tax=Ipomoea nil TaxID=35883 RepID=UPI0009014B4A|nr:PREDICTED: uncharacterized protein LOC109153930 [Ipomoea nil]
MCPGIQPGPKACHMKQKPLGYDKHKALELGIPIEQVKTKRKSRTPRVSEDDQPKSKRQKREKHSSRSKAKKEEATPPVPIPPKSPQEKKDPTPPPETIVVKNSFEEDNLVLSRIIKKGHFRSPVKPKPSPKELSTPKVADTREAPPQGEEVLNEALSEGEAQPKAVLSETLYADQDPKTYLASSQVLHPQEPTLAEQLLRELTQEPADVEMEASRLSLPQEPGSPEKTRGATAELVDEISLPQEPTNAEQVNLTQEPALVEETAVVPVVTPVIPNLSVPATKAPTPDQILRASIESDYQRVLQWQKWRTAPLRTFLETFEAMQDEEDFALKWVGTEDVYKALPTIGSNRGRRNEATSKEDESDENEEEDDDDVDDADDEHDDNDDDDDDNDDQLGNADVQEADPEDSDPILIGPDYDTFPQRSPLRKLPSDSDDPKEASNEHPEDLSRAIVPHVQLMDETSINKRERNCA